MNSLWHEEPRRALVLGAGAAYGAFQIGALRHIIRRQTASFSVMTGASVGAVNATVLAQARTPDEIADPYLHVLEEIWRGIHGSGQIMGRPWARKRLSTIIGMICQAPCTLDPLRELVEKYVYPERLRESPIELAIEVACLDTGRIAVVEPEDPGFIDFLIASCSMPMYFAPVTIEAYLIPAQCCEKLGLPSEARADIEGLPFPSEKSLQRRLRNRGVYGRLGDREVRRLSRQLWQEAEFRTNLHWCDAYIRRILPLTPALKKRPDEVTVIHALPTSRQGKQSDSEEFENFYPRLEQAMSILCHEIQRTNASTTHVLNDLLGKWQELERAVPDSHPLRTLDAWKELEDYLGRYHYVKRMVEISPQPEHMRGHPLDFTPELITDLIKHGQECAAEAVPSEEGVVSFS